MKAHYGYWDHKLDITAHLGTPEWRAQMKAVVKFREKVLALGKESPEAAADILMLCRRDPLFFINTFCMTYRPQDDPSSPMVVPFVCRKIQVQAVKKVVACIGERDLHWTKSRGIGATWLGIYLALWLWLFYENSSVLLGSRKEDYVDKRGNEDALFSKLDQTMSHLPGWMLPVYKRTFLNLRNEELDSTINGESTNPNFGRGGRRSFIWMDEYAFWDYDAQAASSTADVSRCRMFVSTVDGMWTHHHKLSDNPAVEKLDLMWWDDPEKNWGLYWGKNGKLEYCDGTYPFPENYNFVLDGRKRSPAYDRELARRGSQREMDKEWDGIVAGASDVFFDGERIKNLQGEHCEPPRVRGQLLYNEFTGDYSSFVEDENGPVHLWCDLDSLDRPLGIGVLAAGADISQGTGASNSCMSVADVLTGRLICEFVTPHLDPKEFAVYCVALLRWLKGGRKREPTFCWEGSGPTGKTFGKRVLELGYGNYYVQIDDEKLTPRSTNTPGWHATPSRKRELLTNYKQALYRGYLVNPSVDSMRECLSFIYGKDGNPVHSGAVHSEDPSGAKDNHGDRVIAAALMWMMMDGEKQPEPKDPDPPPRSMAWRREMVARALREGTESKWF